MLKQKSTPKNLTGWKYARRHLSGAYGYEYLADTWPERLGTDDIAALQAAGKDYPVFQAWKVCLIKAAEAGELVTQAQEWWLGDIESSEFWTGKKPRKVLIPPCHAHQGDEFLFFKGKVITRDTSSPQDFADYLRKQGEQPSKYTAAWLDAFGVTIEAAGHDCTAIATEQRKAERRQGERRRKTNLAKAVHAAIAVFGRKPSFDELWQFFQNDMDETHFIVDFTDTHITWIDTKGQLHDTKKESLANLLSRINT